MKHRSTNAARFALTGVALAASCLWATQAWALGLGRLSVQSALGETLRAEIDVTSITPEELSTLKLRVAPLEAYRAAGVEFNPVLQGATVELQRRADGRQVLRIASDRAVVEPFVDVILEANWATGRLVREYTLLFDPPGGNRMAQAPAPQTAPSITPAPAPATAPAAAPRPAPAPAPVATSPRTTTEPRATPRPAPAPAPAPAPSEATAGADEYRVKAGDTLSRIASKTQRSGVSLDQMLVALFRGNPQAFAGDNMNRLKSGVVLSVPSAEEAGKLSAAEARETIQAQSADFNAYRQRLAAGTTTTADEGPARQATGKVQANVDDRKAAAAPTPDKLTLSQGGVKSGASTEAKVSKETEKKDANARLAELSRNVDELKKLQGAASAPGKATAPAAPAVVAQAPAPVTPPPPPPPPAPAPAPAPAPVAASAPAVAPLPAVTASAPPAPPSAPTVAKPPAPAPLPVEEPGFLASLMENPLVLPGAGVLVALIAGLGIYRLRGRMRKQGGETSFLESRLQPDSFFGASGGQRIDTREAASTTGNSSMSSMSYSLSQLDAIGDVDPVAEADVYLAYGRDLQAEEILKEAMRANPERMAIRLKLLEVYVKRRDIKGFELLATQVYTLTRGTGEDWAKAQELGRSIDPENPLYQPGGAPELAVGPGGKVIEPLDATTMPHTAKPSTTAPAFVPAADATLSGGLDVDLDLDLGGATTPVPPPPPPAPAEITRPIPGGTLPPLESDMPTMPVMSIAPPPPAPAQEPISEMGSLDFDLGDLPLTPPPPPPADPRDSSPMDFGSFDGGLDTQPPPLSVDGDPLARKLELAEEFRQIGDLEGARDLLEEVIAKADGALKSKAEGMLQALG